MRHQCGGTTENETNKTPRRYEQLRQQQRNTNNSAGLPRWNKVTASGLPKPGEPQFFVTRPTRLPGTPPPCDIRGTIYRAGNIGCRTKTLTTRFCTAANFTRPVYDAAHVAGGRSAWKPGGACRNKCLHHTATEHRSDKPERIQWDTGGLNGGGGGQRAYVSLCQPWTGSRSQHRARIENPMTDIMETHGR